MSSRRAPATTGRRSRGPRARAGIAATIFMPDAAPMAKVDATRSYGATVELVGEYFDDSVDAARVFEERTGATFVHPFEDPRVIAGQGTLGLELAEQLPEGPGTVVIPVGGGGLASGDRDRAAGAPAGAAPGRRAGGGVRAACRARAAAG